MPRGWPAGKKHRGRIIPRRKPAVKSRVVSRGPLLASEPDWVQAQIKLRSRKMPHPLSSDLSSTPSDPHPSPCRSLSQVPRTWTTPKPPKHVKHLQVTLPKPPSHIQHAQTSRAALLLYPPPRVRSFFTGPARTSSWNLDPTEPPGHVEHVRRALPKTTRIRETPTDDPLSSPTPLKSEALL